MSYITENQLSDLSTEHNPKRTQPSQRWALFFCLGMDHLDKDLLAWARVGRYRAGYAGAKVLGYVG